ncbi:MAG: 5'-3' exonuclease H3TH domain-containing protein, partial [Flavobacteriaceae bacterium]|nr:5'-3' exonuclease H3TH domain-containing protein [Flavobacteriaceae bacterium]
MAEKKRLFLVDAYALIFRGYYAFIKNPRINSKGLDTSAIMGFMNSLLDVIKRERPDHLAVCFDKGGSTDRVEMFEEYKSNRLETPEAITASIPYICDILKAMHIPIMVKEGYEADDVIGTLSRQAEKEGYHTYMVTPDKDFAQLVTDCVFMYRPVFGGGYEVWGIPEVKKKFSVTSPEQVIDFLGMMGDSSDNIPGLPGVGEKTAKKFIKQFGSMEGLLDNTDQLKGKMREKVEANKELGLLSKKLATIMLDVPVTFNAKDFELENPNLEEVVKIFDELEFRRLKDNFIKTFADNAMATSGLSAENSNGSPKTEDLKPKVDTSTATAGSGQFSLFGADMSTREITNQVNERKTIDNTPHFYQTVKGGLFQDFFIKGLLSQKSVCFNIETDDSNPLRAHIVGIGFSWETGKGFYFPVPPKGEGDKVALEQLRPFFENEDIQKVAQNLKFDIKVLDKYGIAIEGPLFDTMLAHYIINPDMRHQADVLAETYLNYSLTPIESIIGKRGKNQKTLREVSLAKQTEYVAELADITLQLKEHFKKELGDADNANLFNHIEIPLLRVLASMELEGIKLDKEFLGELSIALETDIANLEKQIFEIAGEEFNIGSPKQL